MSLPYDKHNARRHPKIRVRLSDASYEHLQSLQSRLDTNLTATLEIALALLHAVHFVQPPRPAPLDTDTFEARRDRARRSLEDYLARTTATNDGDPNA